MQVGNSREMRSLLLFCSVKFLAPCSNLTRTTVRFSLALVWPSNVSSGLGDAFFLKKKGDLRAESRFAHFPAIEDYLWWQAWVVVVPQLWLSVFRFSPLALETSLKSMPAAPLKKSRAQIVWGRKAQLCVQHSHRGILLRIVVDSSQLFKIWAFLPNTANAFWRIAFHASPAITAQTNGDLLGLRASGSGLFKTVFVVVLC